VQELHPHIKHLLLCIDLEEKEEIARYRLDKEHTLKQLKAEGLAIHPIKITRRSFGFADYPEINFSIRFPLGQHQFREGAAIELFVLGEEPIKGILRELNGKSGELRLLAPDFPDWLEDDGVGFKLSPDSRTISIMRKGVVSIPKNERLNEWFNHIHGAKELDSNNQIVDDVNVGENTLLNESQQQAVKLMLSIAPIKIIHGPPGTGKTTTLIEGILQLSKLNRRVLVSAPSNTAVDHISQGLVTKGIKILRIGNSSKVNEGIYPFTPEGHLAEGKLKKEVKELKIRAEEFRKMALKYKRSFGKSEREQRKLLFEEVKKIRLEIKKLLQYHEEKLYAEAQVILATPVGIMDANFKADEFDTLIIDEAGQCIEPLAWCIMPYAQHLVLAGDHLQLPPTILSYQAKQKGFDQSILENCFHKITESVLLDTQYRMREMIAGFSSYYFYENKLKAPSTLSNTGIHVTFIDTAGSGFDEERGVDGSSLMNTGELDTAIKLIDSEKILYLNCAFISPYSAQVELAKEKLPKGIRINTIDSFQGQEMHTVILSLVRSNENFDIGFLKDYRRMNVALTRAKEQLYVIGDSATLSKDAFYTAFLKYVETEASYRSCYEWM
jgi:ATP-dependent RNA/DNA helicase IGHMBP2